MDSLARFAWGTEGERKLCLVPYRSFRARKVMIMSILVSDEYNIWGKWVLNTSYIRHVLLLSVLCSSQGLFGHVIVARIDKGQVPLLG